MNSSSLKVPVLAENQSSLKLAQRLCKGGLYHTKKNNNKEMHPYVRARSSKLNYFEATFFAPNLQFSQLSGTSKYSWRQRRNLVVLEISVEEVQSVCFLQSFFFLHRDKEVEKCKY